MVSSLATERSRKITANIPTPRENESPTSYADRMGRWYAAWTPNERKKHFGQYLTPIEVAYFMAGLSRPTGECVRVLDPGAGAGVLSCALLEILSAETASRSVHLEAYEADVDLAKHLEACLFYAGSWLKDRGIGFSFKVCTDDFVLAHAEALWQEPRLFRTESQEKKFDLVISNPPYFKIPKSDARARAAASVVHGQPNIYMLFMATSAALLKQAGELVFITPRSYAAGPYFRRFREVFFSMMKPETIHLFGSRTEAFGKDEVLQENSILHARRLDNWSKASSAATVQVSHTTGVRDLATPTRRNVQLQEILDLQSKDKVLRIPIADRDDEIARVVNEWTGSLHAFGMEISTGPVVPFRAIAFIYPSGKLPTTHAPLLWMQNVTSMCVEWPRHTTRKEQYIIISDTSLPLLVPMKNYVLLRRFSAKEERRRLIAAPFLEKSIECAFVGIENHLNYVYRPKGLMSEKEVYGLAALLNSKVMDAYFRIFNGNTQVSATELRRMPLPPLESIREVGRRVMRSRNVIEEVDQIVSDTLGLPDLFSSVNPHV